MLNLVLIKSFWTTVFRTFDEATADKQFWGLRPSFTVCETSSHATAAYCVRVCRLVLSARFIGNNVIIIIIAHVNTAHVENSLSEQQFYISTWSLQVRRRLCAAEQRCPVSPRRATRLQSPTKQNSAVTLLQGLLGKSGDAAAKWQLHSLQVRVQTWK